MLGRCFFVKHRTGAPPASQKPLNNNPLWALGSLPWRKWIIRAFADVFVLLGREQMQQPVVSAMDVLSYEMLYLDTIPILHLWIKLQEVLRACLVEDFSMEVGQLGPHNNFRRASRRFAGQPRTPMFENSLTAHAGQCSCKHSLMATLETHVESTATSGSSSGDTLGTLLP